VTIPLGSCAAWRAGSSPVARTKLIKGLEPLQIKSFCCLYFYVKLSYMLVDTLKRVGYLIGQQTGICNGNYLYFQNITYYGEEFI